jgi:hypothetical protein
MSGLDNADSMPMLKADFQHEDTQRPQVTGARAHFLVAEFLLKFDSE